MPNLAGKICLVTGASRGIGRGIAIQLITYGATCYVTGRDLIKLNLVRDEAKSRGSTGLCIPIQCDHSVDSEVQNLFEKIANEQNGRLDLLVNNAFSAVHYLMENSKYNFWDLDPSSYDVVNTVGLRNHYFCAVYASRLMVAQKKGLIVNISSLGGKTYFLLPQYGIGKAGKDKMAHDCAAELRKFNVAFISLWPGAVKTESIVEALEKAKNQPQLSKADKMLKKTFSTAESTELSGKCIAYLLADEQIINRSGQIVWTSDIADEFGFKDVDGTPPVSMRSIRYLLMQSPLEAIACYIPSWLKIPQNWFFALVNSRRRELAKEPSSYE